MDNVFIYFLCLPKKAQLGILRSMKSLGILSFSLCSKRTKKLAVLLKVKIGSIEYIVDREINMNLYSNLETLELLFYSIDVDHEELVPLTTPGNVSVEYRSVGEPVERYTWRKAEYEMKDWVEHIFTVFHHSRINELKFEEDCSRFEVNSIANAIRGISIDFLYTHGSRGRAREASEQTLGVFDKTKAVFIDFQSHENSKLIQKTLIRNDEIIIIEETVHLNLNDMLLINSRYIDLSVLKLSLKCLNRFLKLWVRGSNSRLEQLHITFPTFINEDEVLKGISYVKTAENHRRMFRKDSGVMRLPDEVKIDGGCDVRRNDGTAATILVRNLEDLIFSFDMYVWIQ